MHTGRVFCPSGYIKEVVGVSTYHPLPEAEDVHLHPPPGLGLRQDGLENSAAKGNKRLIIDSVAQSGGRWETEIGGAGAVRLSGSRGPPPASFSFLRELFRSRKNARKEAVFAARAGMSTIE